MLEGFCLEKWSLNWEIRVWLRTRRMGYTAIWNSKQRFVFTSFLNENLRFTFRASSLVYITLCQGECAGIQRISGKCQEDGVMLWISKAQKCVLDCLSKHTVPDMNRRDKDASCLTPLKTVKMSRLSGYLQKTSKKRMNRKGSYHCSLIKHCSMTIFRLWRELTLAIQLKDMEQATVSKTLVEDAQREQRRYMEERGKKHEPRFFELRNGRWTPKLQYAFPSFPKKTCI